MADNSKRKTWKGSSTSSEEESSSPTDKKLKFNTSLTEFEAFSESHEAVSVVNMADSALTAESVLPKLELVLQKLSNLELKFDSMEQYVKAVNDKVSNLQVKVECFEEFRKEAAKSMKELEDGMSFANDETESLKEKLRKMEAEFSQLRDEKAYMEVYQRRENLRFFGIKEASTRDTEEDTKTVLLDLLKNELRMDNADSFEFQRVHRIGKRSSSEGKPRQIIARFLRYPDRESVMSRVKKLKGKEFGISADYPKVIIDRRKKKMHLLKKAKEQDIDMQRIIAVLPLKSLLYHVLEIML